MSYQAFAEVYDRLTENVDYESIAVFIERIINQRKPDCPLVLDLACGTGSLCVELSRRGFDMIAVDESADMLSAAREKMPNSGILFLCQPMEELDLFGTIGAAVCTLDSVNHVTDEITLCDVFRRVSLFLEQDGVFIFDANTVYKHTQILGDNTFVYDLDDIYCVWQNSTEGLITEISLDFFIDDGDGCYYRTEESFCERAYPDELLTDMLDKAGMYISEKYDDYCDKMPDAETQRVVYVCRKK